VREIRRRTELEDEPLARCFAAADLRKRVADVAAEHDRPFVRLHDDDLVPVRVARCRHEAHPRQDLRLSVVLDVCGALEVDPLADRVVVLGARVGELAPLDVDRDAGKEALPPQ
jgi:hypothetical protein